MLVILDHQVAGRATGEDFDAAGATKKLEFLKPFAATNTADFTFVPAGNQTTVTWAMFGENGFMAKAIGLVMNVDQMVGGQFEKGLADLKSTVEAKAVRPA